MGIFQELVGAIAQLPVGSVTNSVFSGSQGFLVLIAGLVLAFAFQLLLANFFIALGISYSDSEVQKDQSETLDDTIDKIGTIVGLRTLATLSITLFGACFLAVKLSLINDEVLGAIFGLTIWATYFTLLVWISLTTVGSVIGTVVNSATSGLQGIIGTAAIALGAKQVSDRVVSTAEAAATTVRRELSTAIDYDRSREAISSYLKQLRIPEEDRQQLQLEFEKLIVEPEMQSIARDNQIQNIGRQTFVDLVSSRTDFSKNDVNLAMEQFETFFSQLWGQQVPKPAPDTVLAVLQPAQSEEKSIQLSQELEQLIEQTRKQQATIQAKAAQKVAETAAWWLLGSAFTSAASAAIAGIISVRG
ncbi:MAG: hypothetical protein KME01_16215 [Chroococcus sp. CMT-3BRIN-NPC107]|nr:hypothetical protein [Chroococcus sp. CMT-3BRIN-NPC107]